MSVRLFKSTQKFSLNAAGSIIESAKSDAHIAVDDANDNLYLGGGAGTAPFDFLKSYVDLGEGNSDLGFGFSFWNCLEFASVMKVSNSAKNDGLTMLEAINDGADVRKMSFFGAVAPQAQPGAIGKPAGGATVDAEARAAVDSLIDALKSAPGGLGLTA